MCWGLEETLFTPMVTFKGPTPPLKTLHVSNGFYDMWWLLLHTSQSVESFTAVDISGDHPTSTVFPALTDCYLEGIGSWSLLRMDAQQLEAISFRDWRPLTFDIHIDPEHLPPLPSVKFVRWSGLLKTEFFNNTLERILSSVTTSIETLLLHDIDNFESHGRTSRTQTRRIIRRLTDPEFCPRLRGVHFQGLSRVTLAELQEIVLARKGQLLCATLDLQNERQVQISKPETAAKDSLMLSAASYHLSLLGGASGQGLQWCIRKIPRAEGEPPLKAISE